MIVSIKVGVIQGEGFLNRYLKLNKLCSINVYVKDLFTLDKVLRYGFRIGEKIVCYSTRLSQQPWTFFSLPPLMSKKY